MEELDRSTRGKNAGEKNVRAVERCWIDVEVDLTDLITSWLENMNDRTIKVDFLATSLLNNLMGEVLFAKMKQKCGSQASLEEKLICTTTL